MTIWFSLSSATYLQFAYSPRQWFNRYSLLVKKGNISSLVLIFDTVLPSQIFGISLNVSFCDLDMVGKSSFINMFGSERFLRFPCLILPIIQSHVMFQIYQWCDKKNQNWWSNLDVEDKKIIHTSLFNGALNMNKLVSFLADLRV